MLWTAAGCILSCDDYTACGLRAFAALQGVAFTGLPKEGLCLGVSLFTDKQCVTLLSGDRTSASQNNWSDTPLPVPTLVQQELNKVSQDTEEACVVTVHHESGCWPWSVSGGLSFSLRCFE